MSSRKNRNSYKLTEIDDIPRHCMDIADVLEHDMMFMARSTSDPKILSELSRSQFIRVRCEVAINQHTPKDDLLRMMDDPSSLVLKHLMVNSNITEDAFRKIMDKMSGWIPVMYEVV